MNLNVFDRLILLNVLPHEGDVTTLKIVRKLREDLSFTEEEHKVLQFKQDGGNIRWQLDGDIPKEISIGEKAHDVISGVFKALNESKPPKLKEEHLSLYERFVENVEHR